MTNRPDKAVDHDAYPNAGIGVGDASLFCTTTHVTYDQPEPPESSSIFTETEPMESVLSRFCLRPVLPQTPLHSGFFVGAECTTFSTA
ncbi:hypothetical protein [Spirosoma endophyticum]|uniref:Uncharacterized protein n=1 Tax=Spirosoma endophyticum TaxID=662367 RepID=A0A1I1SN17_9BACT|nr:hypothetical protein [Spirosoma endophyticum]SFD47885.1 hypothetical protein SAMN05216167_105170 [Spirosoma endophyticum]